MTGYDDTVCDDCGGPVEPSAGGLCALCRDAADQEAEQERRAMRDDVEAGLACFHCGQSDDLWRVGAAPFLCARCRDAADLVGEVLGPRAWELPPVWEQC